MGNLKGRLYQRFTGISLLLFGLGSAVIFQNCAEQDFYLSIAKPSAANFSSESDYDLQSPLEARKIDRYVFMVDMSFSMVSGPCQQDVDNNQLFNRSENWATVNGWDPNKMLPDRNESDYQRSGAHDCYVDPEAGPDQFPIQPIFARITPDHVAQNRAIVGSDFKGHRLTVVKKWIEQLRNNLSEERLETARVIIVPFTSGKARERLFDQIRFEYKFLRIKDVAVDHVLEDLERVHNDTFESAIDEDNYHRWKDRAMGASSPTPVLDRLYDTFFEDMDTLANIGVLRKATYNFFVITDGMLTPMQEHLEVAMRTHHRCADFSGDEENAPDVCKTVREAIEEAVGDADSNNRRTLAIKFGKIQGLTQFYGAGRIRNHFVQVNRKYYDKVYGTYASLFEILKREYERYEYKFRYWELIGDEIPFDLATNPVEYQNYSLTGVIILNPNLRIADSGQLQYDSDADGLLDTDEATEGTDPINPRTNGVCLDSLAAHPAYAEKCRAHVEVPDCDPRLDTDMDSLNECEERMLGTNPFDFDTDDDQIPDYFEVLYGYNPILSDKNKDTNGDGVTNLNSFLSGLGPNQTKENIEPNLLSRFRLMERVTDRQENELWISQFTLELDSIPFGAGMVHGVLQAPDECLLYSTRSRGGQSGCRVNGISTQDMLYQVTQDRRRNRGVSLLRLRDKDNDDNVIWKIMKFDITNQNQEVNVFDLGQYRDFDVLDEVND